MRMLTTRICPSTLCLRVYFEASLWVVHGIEHMYNQSFDMFAPSHFPFKPWLRDFHGFPTWSNLIFLHPSHAPSNICCAPFADVQTFFVISSQKEQNKGPHLGELSWTVIQCVFSQSSCLTWLGSWSAGNGNVILSGLPIILRDPQLFKENFKTIYVTCCDNLVVHARKTVGKTYMFQHFQLGRVSLESIVFKVLNGWVCQILRRAFLHIGRIPFVLSVQFMLLNIFGRFSTLCFTPPPKRCDAQNFWPSWTRVRYRNSSSILPNLII